MSILKLLAGPFIGSVIGYCTNYIAIKMLFRPRKAIMIGSFRVPFTPGIIPKEKKRIGQAVGEAVGSTLLTEEDIANTLLNDDIKAYVSDAILEKIREVGQSEKTLQQMASEHICESDYVHYRDEIENIITDKILKAILKVDFGEVISTEANRVVQEKMQGSMLGMFLDEATVQSFIEPIGDRVNQYIEDHGEEQIVPKIQAEFSEMEKQTVGELLGGRQLDEERMTYVIENIFEHMVVEYATKILEKINIAKIIEEKVDAMDVMELEELILSVMNKELKAIVNLGALIGFLLGIFNLLI